MGPDVSRRWGRLGGAAVVAAAALAMIAEGTAVAQSAPTPTSEAAKKSDTATFLSLRNLADREGTSGNTVASGLTLPSDVGTPIQPTGGAGRLQMVHGDAAVATSTSAGRVTPVVPFGDVPGGALANARAPHAEAVIRAQINPAAKKCYENDPGSKAKPPGKLVVLVKLTPTGEVDSVSEAGNLGLSPAVAECIAAAARAAKFPAPGPNGATVRAAFAFPTKENPPAPAVERAKTTPVGNASGKVPATLAKKDGAPTSGQAAHR